MNIYTVQKARSRFCINIVPEDRLQFFIFFKLIWNFVYFLSLEKLLRAVTLPARYSFNLLHSNWCTLLYWILTGSTYKLSFRKFVHFFTDRFHLCKSNCNQAALYDIISCFFEFLLLSVSEIDMANRRVASSNTENVTNVVLLHLEYCYSGLPLRWAFKTEALLIWKFLFFFSIWAALDVS